MANVIYTGAAQTTPQVDTVTIGSATSTETFTVTGGNGISVTYTAGVGETTTTIATALLALLQAVTDGEFTELTFTAATNVITATGPDDGRPFTLSVGGTGTISHATTTTASSPSDLNLGANYSGGSKPGNLDTLVFADSAVDVLWNLDALTAVTCAVVRRSTHTGTIGLPDTSDGGYPEYRKTHVELAGTSLTIETSSTDAAGAVRVKSTAGGAVTLTVTGDQSAALDSEPVEVYGLPASSVVDANGGGVAVAPSDGQAAAVDTLTAGNAAVRCGSGVTLATPTFLGCVYRLACSWTTLTSLGGSQGQVTGAAGGGAAGTIINSGSLDWRSTGGPGNSPVVGSGGSIDFSRAPSSVSVGGTVELNGGSTWHDPRGACGSYSVKLNRCTLQDVTLVVGTNRTLAVS